MITPAIVLQLSLLAYDAGGIRTSKKLPQDAAEAIADECARAPLYYNPAIPGELYCAALYVFHSFRESGWDLYAVGDGGKAHGPFQVWGRAPRSWKDAVAQFAPLLKRASVCDEPLEMLAAGKCGTEIGKRISRARTDGARGIVVAWFLDPGTVYP